MDVAYIYVRKVHPNYLDALDDLYGKADSIQKLYDAGKITDTRYLSINNQAPEINLNIYPNPANGYFVISFSTLKSRAVNLKICDLSGKTVFENNYTSSGKIIINRNNLNPGFYIVSLESEGNSIHKKIIFK